MLKFPEIFQWKHLGLISFKYQLSHILQAPNTQNGLNLMYLNQDILLGALGTEPLLLFVSHHKRSQHLKDQTVIINPRNFFCICTWINKLIGLNPFLPLSDIIYKHKPTLIWLEDGFGPHYLPFPKFHS